MFSWCRTQIEEHGISVAAGLIGRVAWSRARIILSNSLLPAKLECPCCGWKGRRFLDYIEVGYALPNVACPQCDSHPRHRAFFLWLQGSYHLGKREVLALIFAPEQSLASLWQQAAQLRQIRIDIAGARNVDVCANAESLPIVSDSIDLIWCHHVLEHVEHDRKAIEELHRVLRPTLGELIISVPMEPNTQTREYGFANPHESGHWRMYGDDFADRLAEKGLSVETLVHELTPQISRQYGIVPEPFYVCRKDGSLTAGNR
jgi:SAM-dependent methyltransferase